MSLPDLELMRLALAAAEKGGHAVRPNPLVGCAIETKSGEIIVSHHEKYGANHAERNAFEIARRQNLNLTGGRIAVTLEPCSHHGKTPPCVDLLLEEKWAEVLIGVRDPNPLVSGRGIEKLRGAGIPVKVGVLEDEATLLNKHWLKSQQLGRAHVTLKMATSLDGRMSADNGESQWITSPRARARALATRSRFSAILTGGETVRRDDPSMTARDSANRLLENQPAIFVLSHDPQFDLSKYKISTHPAGARLVVDAQPENFLKTMLKDGLYDVLLECGPSLAQDFLHRGLVDEIHWYFESTLLGGRKGKGLVEAFNGGALPGLEFKIGEIEKISDTSFLVQLTK